MVNRTVDSAIEVTIQTPQTISKQDNLLCKALIRFCGRNKIEVRRTMPLTKDQMKKWLAGEEPPPPQMGPRSPRTA